MIKFRWSHLSIMNILPIPSSLEINFIYFSMHFRSIAVRIEVFAIIQLQVHSTRHLGRIKNFYPTIYRFITSRFTALLQWKHFNNPSTFLWRNHIPSLHNIIVPESYKLYFILFFNISFSFLLAQENSCKC